MKALMNAVFKLRNVFEVFAFHTKINLILFFFVFAIKFVNNTII